MVVRVIKDHLCDHQDLTRSSGVSSTPSRRQMARDRMRTASSAENIDWRHHNDKEQP
jgi:hypothetical protein